MVARFMFKYWFKFWVFVRIFWFVCWYIANRLAILQLTESSVDIVFGQFVFQVCEYFLCGSVFYELSRVEECCVVGNAGCLLHVMCDHNYRIVIF